MDAIWRLDIASGQAITKAPELAGRPGTCDLRIQSGLGSPFLAAEQICEVVRWWSGLSVRLGEVSRGAWINCYKINARPLLASCFLLLASCSVFCALCSVPCALCPVLLAVSVSESQLTFLPAAVRSFLTDHSRSSPYSKEES
jgi:hypothetical protein